MDHRIAIDPAICHGRPVIRGTRITVAQVVSALAGGDTVEDLLADYPSLCREDVQAALHFAADLADHEVELLAG